MRLIDNSDGHLFVLPPANVILLAPKRAAMPVVLTFGPPPAAPRSLVVHCGRGCAEVVWLQTASK